MTMFLPHEMDTDAASDCSGSSHSHSSISECEPIPEDASEYITIYLTEDDPTNTTFISSSGKQLYQTSSTGGSKSSHKTSDTSTQRPHTTRVSRLYGKAARAATTEHASLEAGTAHGLTLAEMEWLKRTKASRVRFSSGSVPSKQYIVDLRVDEFLKSTKGRSLSRMFAAPDGHIYKWKADVDFPAELVECEDGRRISGRLVTFQNGSIYGGMSSLRISTSVLHIIDHIIVSWVIMERERRLHESETSYTTA